MEYLVSGKEMKGQLEILSFFATEVYDVIPDLEYTMIVDALFGVGPILFPESRLAAKIVCTEMGTPKEYPGKAPPDIFHLKGQEKGLLAVRQARLLI